MYEIILSRDDRFTPRILFTFLKSVVDATTVVITVSRVRRAITPQWKYERGKCKVHSKTFFLPSRLGDAA